MNGYLSTHLVGFVCPDCDIWVQDDCIAVKDVKKHEGIEFNPVSSNMVFERINASGLVDSRYSCQKHHI